VHTIASTRARERRWHREQEALVVRVLAARRVAYRKLVSLDRAHREGMNQMSARTFYVIGWFCLAAAICVAGRILGVW
jgi:hypothetical protein